MPATYLRIDGENYALVPRAEARSLPPEYKPVPPAQARWLLRAGGDPGHTRKLSLPRGFLEGRSAMRPMERGMPSRDRWADLIGDGDGPYLLFRREEKQRPVSDSDGAEAAVPLADLATEEPPDEIVEHWIEVLMVDEEDNPLVGIPCEIELADGRVCSGSTNDFGMVRIDGIVAGGPAKIRFPTLDGAVVEAR